MPSTLKEKHEIIFLNQSFVPLSVSLMDKFILSQEYQYFVIPLPLAVRVTWRSVVLWDICYCHCKYNENI